MGPELTEFSNEFSLEYASMSGLAQMGGVQNSSDHNYDTGSFVMTAGVVTPGVLTPGLMTPGVMTPRVMTPGVTATGRYDTGSFRTALDGFVKLIPGCSCRTSDPTRR